MRRLSETSSRDILETHINRKLTEAYLPHLYAIISGEEKKVFQCIFIDLPFHIFMVMHEYLPQYKNEISMFYGCGYHAMH